MTKNWSQKKFHEDLVKSFARGALGGASIEIQGAGIEARAGHGLIAGHAYTLSAAIHIPDTG